MGLSFQKVNKLAALNGQILNRELCFYYYYYFVVKDATSHECVI